MHPTTEALVQNCEALTERWNALYTRWVEGGLPTEERFTRLLNSTMKEYSQRVHAGLTMLSSLRDADEATDLLILHRLEPAQKNLKSALSAVDTLLNQLNARPDAEFKIQEQSMETLKVFIGGQHTENVSFGGTFDQLNAALGSLIDLALLGLKTRKVRAIGHFSDAANQILTILADANLRLKALKETYSSANKLLDEVKAARNDTNRWLSEAEQGANAVEAARDATADLQSEAEAKVASIREIAVAAGALETKVQAFDSNFEGFKQSLDARVAQHTAFEKDMQSAMQANQVREKEIDSLLQQSEDMIKGATTAGLGTSLEETRKVYETKMNAASTSFKWSVAFLVFSALPLVLHLFPGLFGTWLGARPTLAPGELFNSGAAMELVGKMFLLFPATWTTQFFSKAYSEYFHLEREYAHKAALARAVEGFKRQAPKYEEEITTSVFFEVQSNPSKQASPDAAEHPILGPVLRKFMDALPLPGKEKKAEE